MNKEWLLLIKKYDVESSRIKFENICEKLFKRLNSGKRVGTVSVNQGDGGIDVFIGEIGIEPIDVIQCKFFVNGIDDTQKNQIRDSFRRAVESRDFDTKSWTLCIVNQLNLQQNIWWSNWKKGVQAKYGLTDDFIQLKDGNELSDLLKSYDLYNDSFELEDSIMLTEIHDKVVKSNLVPDVNINEIIKKASSTFLQIRNFIENRSGVHIDRQETQIIYKWIISPLPEKQRNILILKGQKGFGKSAIQKDLYEKLLQEDYNVIGIKADKFYASTLGELESKLFSGQLSFDAILKESQRHNKKLVVIIDQIDALSLTLSSGREYIETYNNLILQLQCNTNVRIIISVRDYDLKYDAELSIYNSDAYKKVSVGRLVEKDIKNVLSLFNIKCPSEKVLELLKNPNNLDIYCRIYEGSSKKPIDTISSLKDLYDQLWRKYISRSRNLNLKDLIYIIAQRMYSEQRISVGNVYEDDFYNEMHYLNSNSLLSEFNGEIQFFHQSFYEYCFARQFVENGENLEDFILANDQSLYVRAVIKMVLEYQREYDIKGYAAEIKNILSGAEFRFHVKSLILNILGAVSNPAAAERELAVNVILKNIDYEDIFMCSILSRSWTEFFIAENIVHKYFSLQKNEEYQGEHDMVLKEKISNFSWVFFRSNIVQCPLVIFEFLDSIDFEDKQYYISRLLIQIEDWSEEKLFFYFEKYMPYQADRKTKRDNYWFFEILKKIFPNNNQYSFNKLAPAILEVYKADLHRDEFEYSLNEVVKYFYEHSAKKTFEFLFTLYIQVSDNTKNQYFTHDKISTPLNINSGLDDREIFSTEDIKNIKNYLYDYLKTCSREEVSDLFSAYKNSNNVNILTLLIKCLKHHCFIFINEITELLYILKNKNAFSGADDNFQLEIRNIIAVIYSSLDSEQLCRVNEILLSVNSKHDYHFYTENGKRRVHLKSFGKKKYLFIKSVPLKELRRQKELYRNYLELQRKFGDADEKKALHVSRSQWGAVGPPLNESAYEKMDLKNWKNSMIKFNESFKHTGWLKGDIFDHSNVFSRKVSESPERYYDFLESLFYETKVSSVYILSGLGGLVDGKYDPDKVKKLFKMYLKCRFDSTGYHRTHLNHYAGYLIKNRNIDAEIVKFLADTVLYFDEKKSVSDSSATLDNAVNTIKGSALYQLMHCYENIEFEEIIFSTIEKVIKQEPNNDKLKVTILHNLAFLNNLNTDRAFAVFRELTDTDNIEVLRSSLHTSQYFNNICHDNMSYYFDKILLFPELHKKSYVMVSSWLRGHDKNKKIYNKFISKGKDARLCAVDVAEEFLINEDQTVNQKALDILSEFVHETDEEFGPEYSGIILRRFKPKNFMHFHVFLQNYSKSVLCRYEPSYFFEYLLGCAKDHPKECLEFLNYMDFSTVPDIQERGYYDKEPVQLVLGIYSKLVSQVNKDKALIENALDIFDCILKNSILRVKANQGMETML